MPLDLVSRRGDRVLSFNWHGWAVLADLIERLGCATSTLSFTNDGDYIPAPVCRQFSAALIHALGAHGTDRLVKVWEPDARICGGWSNRFARLADLGDDVEVSAGPVPPGYGTHTTADPGMSKLVSELDSSGERWLLEAAHFLSSCGGCRQC